jgi:peptidoglycan/LPS O-acetylase OafA/YrhL
VHQPVGLVINNLLLPPLEALLILSIAQEKTWLQFILNLKIFQVLGTASYAFYLIHHGPVANQLNGIFPLGNNAVAFLFLWSVACLLYIGIERPLYRRFRVAIDRDRRQGTL